MIRITIIGAVSILAVSCGKSETVRDNRVQRLERQVDSLNTILKDLQIVAQVDNLSFKTGTNKPYVLKLQGVVLNALKVDSVYINGINSSRFGDSLDIIEDEFGTTIKFDSDTVGEFDFKAFTSSFYWPTGKIVPVTWPLTVTKNAPN